MQAFGGKCENLNQMPEGFDLADQIAHPNICGFGKAVLEAVMTGKVKELVLVNCCDTIRSVYDILEDSGKLDFLYMIDMLHCDGECRRERTVLQLKGLARAYGAYKGSEFDQKNLLKHLKNQKSRKNHISVFLGQEWEMNYMKWSKNPCHIQWRMILVSITEASVK